MRKLYAIALALTVTLGVTGCSDAQMEEARGALSGAMNKTAKEVKQYHADTEMMFKVYLSQGAGTVEIGMFGQQDSATSQDQSQMTITYKAAGPIKEMLKAQGVPESAELTLDSERIGMDNYFKLTSIKVQPAEYQELVDGIIGDYIGKTFSLSMDDLSAMTGQDISQINMTEDVSLYNTMLDSMVMSMDSNPELKAAGFKMSESDMEKFLDKLLSADYMDVTNVSQTANGTVYDVKLNPEGLTDIVRQMIVLGIENGSFKGNEDQVRAEMQSLDEMTNAMRESTFFDNTTIQITVGNEGYITEAKMNMDLQIDDDSAQIDRIQFDMDMTMSKFNEPFTVQKPEGEVTDIMSLLGDYLPALMEGSF